MQKIFAVTSVISLIVEVSGGFLCLWLRQCSSAQSMWNS